MDKTQQPSAVKKARGKGEKAIMEAEAAMDAAEHLGRDLARVRAKFGMDPVLAPRSLSAAWMSETPIEEDEAEFVDTVADCLGAGLSLEDALTCWDTGDLASDAAADSAADAEDESIVPVVAHAARRPFPGGHRVLVR